MTASKRKTGTLPRNIQQIIREEREKAAAEFTAAQEKELKARDTQRIEREKQETHPLQIPKHEVQSPQDIIKTFSTEEINALIQACHTELQLRGAQTVPDLSVLLQEWKRLHGIDK